MTDITKGMILEPVEFVAQDHDIGCSMPPEEVGWGLTGGGYGTYGYCPDCGAIAWKHMEDEDWE